MPTLNALIIDDDENFRVSLELLVKRENFGTRGAGSVAEARAMIEQDRPDVLLVDLSLPDAEGLGWLKEEPVVEGIEDGPCFDNGTCNGGLICDLGTCVPGGTQVTEPPDDEKGFPLSCSTGSAPATFGLAGLAVVALARRRR